LTTTSRKGEGNHV